MMYDSTVHIDQNLNITINDNFEERMYSFSSLLFIIEFLQQIIMLKYHLYQGLTIPNLLLIIYCTFNFMSILIPLKKLLQKYYEQNKKILYIYIKYENNYCFFR